MAYSPTLIGALVLHRPAEATRQIIAAYENVGGRSETVASKLGVTKRTLDRWVAILDLRKVVERIQKRARMDPKKSDGLKRKSKPLPIGGGHPPTPSKRK